MKKGEIEIDVLVKWGIALAILILVFIIYFILKGKGIGAIEYLKNMLNFRG